MSARASSSLILVALLGVGCFDFSRFDTLPDAAAPDLGAVDLAGPDFGGGPSLCGALSTIEGELGCTGFEDPLDTLPTSIAMGTAEIDPTRSFRGTGSMHLTVGPGMSGQRSAAEARQALGSPGAFTSVRAFFYLPAMPTLETRLVTIQQDEPPFHFIQIGVTPQGRIFRSHKPADGSSALAKIATRRLPIGAWVCTELRVTWGPTGTGKTRVLVDDEPVPELDDDTATEEASPLDAAIVGLFFEPGPSIGYDVWIDEVAIATAPIGCAR